MLSNVSLNRSHNELNIPFGFVGLIAVVSNAYACGGATTLSVNVDQLEIINIQQT